MKLRGLSRRWAARGSVAAVAAVTLAAGLQAAATAAVHRSVPASPHDPYSPAYHHPYRHGFVPTRATARKMRAWAAAQPASAAATPPPPSDLTFGGGIDNIGVTTGRPHVYLVFYGSQWGAQSTNGKGDVILASDTSGEAPYLQELFRGLGTGGEQWSGVMTQYCDGSAVATGATSCPSSASFAGYPLGGALAGVWVDESAASPGQATGHQLGLEAVKAAAHFGNTTAAANRDAQYVIASPHGTDPDGWIYNGFCAWHDYNGDTTLSGGPVTSPYGDIAFTNLPYQTDAGASCGQDFVNSGSAGTLDGVSIVEGHEYAETITDQNPPGGWTEPSSNSYWYGAENADVCAWISPGTPGGAGNLTLPSGTFAMQSTWSNDANGGNGDCAFSHPVPASETSGNTVTVTNPGGQSGPPGTAVNLPVSATDSDGTQTLSYSAAGLPAGLSIDSATGTITGKPATGGRYTVTVTAADGTGASGSASFTWTVTCGTGQLLGNPGFETGSLKPWTASAGVLQHKGTYPAHQGNWLARLDGRSGKHTDTLAQKVSLPKACTSATFAFYLQVRSNDPTKKAKAWDTLGVQVLNSKGTVLKTLATYSNKNTRNSYFRHSFSLKPYLGQTITIRFTGRETLTKHNTAFLVDDNALNVS